ncbi:MAG: aminotransferase class I/II-fold pyridoxal phosphate-dependent enzyme [Lachnospiraceae bacterium]|nr:aminotransferase class I/II-fold pyridoxal phosphate-dependent enzyme [Lachnospiraceae bacterium]MDE7020537.1 aminotransferase class I/II-fold pyridoxal phosphate-dependent enzyme [Lachnospiraceae bacterium]
MKYNFTDVIERKGKDAIAAEVIPYADFQVKEGFSRIPMWIADMSFATVPAVPKIMMERAAHPLYGYFEPKEEYYEAIIRWQEERNGVQGLTKECIGYENGVLGGVVSALNVICSKGDKVLLHSPAYVGFTGSLENNGYDIVHSPLQKDESGIWRMDFADMEEKLRKHSIHAAIFCSPHNPCGRVWERWELEQAMELFRKYDVMVVADEIWSDIILGNNRHIPVQSVSEDARMRTAALYAPSKTFNLAGLVGSYHIIYNKWLRDRVLKESSLSHYNSMNVLSMYGLIGAYSKEGAEWVEELLSVLGENAAYACDYIDRHFPGVSVARPQGTYMLLLDCSEWCANHGKTIDEVQRAGVEVGVIWQDGRPFHSECGIRMNLALPKTLLEEAMERLHKYVFV